MTESQRADIRRVVERVNGEMGAAVEGVPIVGLMTNVEGWTEDEALAFLDGILNCEHAISELYKHGKETLHCTEDLVLHTRWWAAAVICHGAKLLGIEGDPKAAAQARGEDGVIAEKDA